MKDILIVDDNISLSRTMSFVLKRKGYRITTADSGLEAISTVKESPFDIIFMDIKMPGMNGVEAFKQIKNVRPDTPVIMMTAYSVSDLMQEAIEEGAYAILHKPLDFDKILSLITKVINAEESTFILVVDDDSGTCTTLKNILLKRGYKVGTAESGTEAIEAVEKVAFDIIFIDMRMPVLNGLETYLAIKAVSPKSVAVIMTAYRGEINGLIEEALRNSAYTCLSKPLDMEVLFQIVGEIQKVRPNQKHAR